MRVRSPATAENALLALKHPPAHVLIYTALLMEASEDTSQKTPSSVNMGPSVIVVGGGVAGLAAARHIAASGHKILVLEARDRLGGRIHTLNLSREAGSVDLGARCAPLATIHSTSQMPTVGLTQSFIHGVTGNPLVKVAKENNLVWIALCRAYTHRCSLMTRYISAPAKVRKFKHAY